jgi:hypothetical protein
VVRARGQRAQTPQLSENGLKRTIGVRGTNPKAVNLLNNGTFRAEG